MTLYKILVEPAGYMHQQPEPGGLGWRARETSFEIDTDDFSYLILLENNKLFVTRELIKILGKERITPGEKVHLEHRRYAYELSIQDWQCWFQLTNLSEPKGQRDQQVKDRNLELLEFLGQLLQVVF